MANRSEQDVTVAVMRFIIFATPLPAAHAPSSTARHTALLSAVSESRETPRSSQTITAVTLGTKSYVRSGSNGVDIEVSRHYALSVLNFQNIAVSTDDWMVYF